MIPLRWPLGIITGLIIAVCCLGALNVGDADAFAPPSPPVGNPPASYQPISDATERAFWKIVEASRGSGYGADPAKKQIAQEILSRQLVRTTPNLAGRVAARGGLITAAAAAWTVVGLELYYLPCWSCGSEQVNVAAQLRRAPGAIGGLRVGPFSGSQSGQTEGYMTYVGGHRNANGTDAYQEVYGMIHVTRWLRTVTGTGNTLWQAQMPSLQGTSSFLGDVYNPSSLSITEPGTTDVTPPSYKRYHQRVWTGTTTNTMSARMQSYQEYPGGPSVTTSVVICPAGTVACTFSKTYPVIQTGEWGGPMPSSNPFKIPAHEGNDLIQSVVLDPEAPEVLPEEDLPPLPEPDPDWDPNTDPFSPLPLPTEDPLGDPDGDDVPNKDDDDPEGDEDPDEDGDPNEHPRPAPWPAPDDPEEDGDPDHDGNPDETDTPVPNELPNDDPNADPDEDGEPNKTDPDNDDDGIPDEDDPAPNIPTDPDQLPDDHPYGDPDGDDVPNKDDDDDDGDGAPDEVDPNPYDPDPDTDGDGDIDPLDPDDDGDGIPDEVDPHPLDPDTDTDGDQEPDETDPDPDDPTDPNPDNEPGPDTDTDGDGEPDATDPDDDNDGLPDEVDPDPDDPTDPNTDGQPDMDEDGIPDPWDPDIDGDGIPNETDPDPDDKTDPDDTPENQPDPTADPDGDGDPNETDPDDDGDNVPDETDPDPDDPTDPEPQSPPGECNVTPPNNHFDEDGRPHASSLFPFNLLIMAVDMLNTLDAPPETPTLPAWWQGGDEVSLSSLDGVASACRQLLAVVGIIGCGFMCYQLISQSKEGD